MSLSMPLLHSQWDCRLYNICCSAIRAVIPFPTHTAITHASLLLLLLWSFRALGKLNPRQRIRSKGNEVKCWAVNGIYTHSLVGWYIGNQCPSSATAEAEATSCCLDIKTPSEGAARPVFVPFPDGNLTPQTRYAWGSGRSTLKHAASWQTFLQLLSFVSFFFFFFELTDFCNLSLSLCLSPRTRSHTQTYTHTHAHTHTNIYARTHTHQSCRITCERSEPVRQRRIALYKNDQQCGHA